MWKFIKMEFKNKLKQIRTENGLTQEQLSKLTGLSISTIKKYEIGLIEPSPDSILRFCEGLNINPVEFADSIPWIDEFLEMVNAHEIQR